MKKEDIRALIIFILLIISIIGLWIYNSKDRKIDNVDRKINKIFNMYSYGLVLNEGRNLFFEAVKISNTNNLLVEKNSNNRIVFYSIEDKSGYKKIQNFNEVKAILTKDEIEKYMLKNKIIEYKNNYYILDNKFKYNDSYVGSEVNILKYDDEYVYFKCINYYCDDYQFEGLLNKAPTCDYQKNESEFTLTKENNNLRINDLESISKIIE